MSNTKVLLDTQVRQLVIELQNTLSCQDATKKERTLAFNTVGELLGIHDCGILSERFSVSSSTDIQTNFQELHYSRLLEFLVERLSVEWVRNLPSDGVPLEDVFVKGVPKDAFLVLCKAVSQNSSGYALHKCVWLLEKFIKADKLCDMFWSQCMVSGGLDSYQAGYERQQWDLLNSYVATLPERVTNRLHTEASDIFYPEAYISTVCGALLSCLSRVHGSLTRREDVGGGYLSHLLGKLCMCGHTERVWLSLLPSLLPLIQGAALWSRVCERLVSSVPDQQLEAVITPLLQQLTWYGYTSKFLGHSVLENPKVKFLLTNKLLVLRHFKQSRILQNILGYMYDSTTLKPLFLKTLIKLLSVWADKSALKHTSYEQHIYITRAILVAAAFISDNDAKQIHNEILEQLMEGLQHHLDSPLPGVRRQGMIVAETLTAKIHTQGEEKLKFQYEDDSECQELKALLTIPIEPQMDHLQTTLAHTRLEEDRGNNGGKAEGCNQANVTREEEELDSDDDLAPYYLSNDRKLTKTQKPLYIRDCMEGLIKSGEDPDRLECCLQEAETLVRQHTTAAREVSVELMRILLHLQDSFALPGFTVLRHRSMVAVLVTEPSGVAEYLTSQFYERNYNIRQRLDILEVLCAGAKELSDPSTADSSTRSKPSLLHSNTSMLGVGDNRNEGEELNWREVVQKRIDSKTRRFASGNRREVSAVANRFMSVAGEFFFPLLQHFDRPSNCLDILGEDHLVLGRLVYTLGVLVHAAQHTLVCRNMGKSLLEFIWAMRYHPQPAVKRGLLFATCMVFLSLPPHVLFEDLQSQVTETKTWLQDVVSDDSDTESQKMAAQALIVMDKLLQQLARDRLLRFPWKS